MSRPRHNSSSSKLSFRQMLLRLGYNQENMVERIRELLQFFDWVIIGRIWWKVFENYSSFFTHLRKFLKLSISYEINGLYLWVMNLAIIHNKNRPVARISIAKWQHSVSDKSIKQSFVKRALDNFPVHESVNSIHRKYRPTFRTFNALINVRSYTNRCPSKLAIRGTFIGRRFIKKQ